MRSTSARSPRRAARSRSRSCRPGRSSRSKRSPRHNASKHNAPMRRELEDYVDSLGLDAYLVGGAVRDELLGLDSKDADFLVPGVDTEGLKAKLAPHGRVEDLVVAGRLAGARLHPSEKRNRRLAPKRIEVATPRKQVNI